MKGAAETRTGTVGPRFDRHSRAAFIVACCTLLIAAVGFRGAVRALNVFLKKEPVQLRSPLSLIPTTLGSWKAAGSDTVYEAATIEALGTNMYLDRTYKLEGGSGDDVLKLHLAYYTGMIDTIPHVPDRCFDAAGLNAKTLPHNLPLSIDQGGWIPDPEDLVSLATGEVYDVAMTRDRAGRSTWVRMPTGDFTLRTLEFEDQRQPNWRIYGGYFFIANNRMTPSPEGVKALAFNLTEKYAYYCKVQYVYVSPEATEERFISLVSDHLQRLIPELMRCLPDWAEVERRDAATEISRQSSNAKAQQSVLVPPPSPL